MRASHWDIDEDSGVWDAIGRLFDSPYYFRESLRTTYFVVSGNKCYKYDWTNKRTIGRALAVDSCFQGMAPQGLTAAFQYYHNKAYLFNGRKYFRFDPKKKPYAHNSSNTTSAQFGKIGSCA